MLSASETAQHQAREYNTLTNLLTRYQHQKNKGVLTEEQYNAKVQATQTRLAALTAQTETLTIKQRLLAGVTKTVATAFNMLKMAAVTFAVTGIIALITKVVNKQKELAEQAKEAADKAKEQADAFSDLKTQYLAIIDSADDEVTKTEKLNEWKNTLIETYGFEKEALENLNTEREKGIELLEQESKSGIKSTYQNYLVDNSKEIEKSKKKLGQSGEFNIFTGSQIDVDKNAEYGVAKQLQKYFDVESGYYYNNLNYKLSINFDDAVDELSQLQKIQNEINNIESERKVVGKGLTEDEKLIRQYVGSEIDRIEKLNEKYLNTYQSSGEAGAWVKFYTDNNQTALENAGEEGYLNWREAFINQAESPAEKREMEKILAENLPDLENIYKNLETRNNNLDLAKSKFGISDIINSATEGMKLAFINSLDDTDLDILVNKIEDPFAEGIEGAKKLIADFKADPNNKVSVETDTKSIDDMLKAVEDYSKSANTYVKNQKTVTAALEEQSKYGKLASSTVIELTDAGYASALVYDKETGAITLNKQAVENLNVQKQLELKFNLVKEKSEIEQKYKDEATAVGELQREMATANETRREAIRLEIAEKSKNMAEYYDMISQYNGLLNSIGNYTPDNSGGKKDTDEPKSVQDFKTELARRQHEINMGRMQEDEAYYDWLLSAAHTAYDGLADYQDELWKHEEEVYKWRQEQEQKLFDKKIDNLEKLADKALDKNVDSNGNELTVTVSFDYAREQINSAIAETQARIDGIKNGTISGDNDDIETLIDDLDSLYDKLTDINEKEIDSQKEYIKTLKDEYSDLIDEQIDQQKKLADNIEKAFEKQIDNIDKQIDAINKVNEAEEHQKNILEAQEAVKEAQKNLDKASVNTRLVYTGNGGYALRSDKDAVEEAKKNLADKQAELQKAMDEQKIAVLEEQKESLETQKNNSKDYYDKVVDDLEEQKTAREKQYDLLIDIYEQLGGEKKQTSLNDSLVTKLTANGDINKAVQGLTPTEMRKAITSGILTTDSEGNYAIDYSILSENEKAVNDNTAELQKTKSELEKLNSSLSGSPDNTTADTAHKNLDAEGYLIGTDGKRVLNGGKPIHAKKNPNIVPISKLDTSALKDRQTAELVNALKTVRTNQFSPITYTAPKVTPYLGESMNISANNSPTVNFTVNVDGSADEKTVQAMKNEITNTLVECFNYWGNSIDAAFTRQINKSSR